MQGLELLIGKIMLIGAILSAIFTMVGAAILLSQHGAEPIHYHLFNPVNSYVDNYYSARGLIEIGLYILVMTQIVRVALTGWIFIKYRDKWFIIFSLFILGMLIYSLII